MTPRGHSMRTIAACFALIVATSSILSAQETLPFATTTVYDTALVTRLQRAHTAVLNSSVIVFDPITGQASVTLTNPSSTPLPVDLSLDFYTVKTDGDSTLQSPTIRSAQERSMVPWVKGLPRRITLAPNASQTIPLTLDVPAKVDSGEYWARLNARSGSTMETIPGVTLGLFDQGPGKQPALEQQATMLSSAIEMSAMAKLVYRRGTAKPAVTVSNLSASWVPASGQVHVCMTLTHAGTGAAFIAARFAVQTRAGTDTLIQRSPFEIQQTVNPCFTFPAFALSPGKYTVSLGVTSDRPDLPEEVRTPFEPSTTTATFEVPPGKTPDGPPEPPAPKFPIAKNGVPLIEIMPGHGTLVEQLQREAHLAAKEHKIALVEIGAAWCGPCQAFLHALSDPRMVDAMHDVRVVRIDFDRWGTSFLGNTSYAFPAALPTFFTLKMDGTAETPFDPMHWVEHAGANGALDAEAMAPAFKEFIVAEQGRHQTTQNPSAQ